MPLPAITNGYYAQIRSVLHSSQFAEVTMCFVASSTTSADLGQLIGDTWHDEVMGNLSADYFLTSVLVTKLDTVSAGVDTGFAIAGGDGNGALPDQVALGVTLQTGLAGRSRRGRWYIPGIPNNQVDGDPSLFKSTYVATMQGNVDSFMSAMATGGAELQVLSRAIPDAQPVTSLLVRRQIRTQRRRLTGGI
jgi:hypothetical protein